MRKNVVTILDFGFAENPDVPSTIHDLGDCALSHRAAAHEDMDILAQSATYTYLCKKSPELAQSGRLHEIRVAQSDANNGGGLKDGSTYCVLQRAAEMLHELDLGTQEASYYLIAHQVHVPRALRQAELVGFPTMTPYHDIPSQLYSSAAQWWCRSKPFWYLREVIGYFFLKLAGQI